MIKVAKRAQSVLTARIDGVHSETGAELAEESVLQDMVVVCSLLIARGALEAAEARTARQALLPRGAEELGAQMRKGRPVHQQDRRRSFPHRQSN